VYNGFGQLFKTVALNMTIDTSSAMTIPHNDKWKIRASNMKRTACFGILGMLLATSMIFAVQFLPIFNATGLLIVKVKDAPAELEELWLQIDGVNVHRSGGGSWMDVTVVETDPFDLMILTDFATVLATEELPIGSYTEIRFHVTDAYATIGGETGIPLEIQPSTGWFMVKTQFTLEEEGVTTIIIDIDVNDTPIVNTRKLHPVVKATVEEIGASKPVQTHYRWADNDDAESPTWKADQDIAITNIGLTGEVLRLRLAIKNEGEAIWSSTQLTLQYATNREGPWSDVEAQGGTGPWRYSDGLGSDQTAVTNLYLTGSTIHEHFMESTPTVILTKLQIGYQGEWDICIESNGAYADTTYYFRFIRSNGTPLNDYVNYPTLTTIT